MRCKLLNCAVHSCTILLYLVCTTLVLEFYTECLILYVASVPTIRELFLLVSNTTKIGDKLRSLLEYDCRRGIQNVKKSTAKLTTRASQKLARASCIGSDARGSG